MSNPAHPGCEWIAVRYAAIVQGLGAVEIAAVWAATLFGSKPVDGRLGDRAKQLGALRDDVGRASALRNENARSDAA